MSVVAELDEVCLQKGGFPLLVDVTLRVEAGDRLALSGPNGAGKTTLLRVLAGLERPQQARALRLPEGVGYAPQDYATGLFPWFSVLRNVALPLLVRGRGDALEVARGLCARLMPELDPHRSAGRLSGGEAQLVSLARALAAPGEIVLADEPFSALSRAARARVLARLSGELGARALVLVTHSGDDVAALCDRAVELAGGRLREPHPGEGAA